MTVLAEMISVTSRFARSASLERDVGQTAPLDGYVVTARALDVVQRVASVAAAGTAGGAWSITGPYGSGKSSLAVLLDGLFCDSGETRSKAMGLIEEASPAAAELVDAAHHHRSTGDRGFTSAVVTAAREPVSHTVVRALHRAVQDRFGKMPTASVFPAVRELKSAMAAVDGDDPRRSGPATAALVEVARALAMDAPLLLIIDEFGKNLEAVADRSDADPYLLQQLAEAGQGAGSAIFMLTMQHLSFEDYFVGIDSHQQREWAKVQGRFNDVPYVESAAQTRTLIGSVFTIGGQELRPRVEEWAVQRSKQMAALGMPALADSDDIEHWYPIDPFAVAVLPELCNRYGQSERTLFSFLTGTEPAGVVGRLRTQSLGGGPDGLPTIGLAEIYEYFIAGGAATAGSATASRWVEVATRLRDVAGLSDAETRLVRSIAVLNLVGAGGSLRASREVLAQLDDGDSSALAGLESRGIVTYRGFADEYRVWQGSDLDLGGLIGAAEARLKSTPTAELIGTLEDPRPVIAARHSAQNDMLRIFEQRFVTGGEEIDPVAARGPLDGLVALVVGGSGALPKLSVPDLHAKPVLAAVPEETDAVETAARNCAALRAVLDDATVEHDWVARRELGERLADASRRLDLALQDAFGTSSCRWLLLRSDGNRELAGGRGSAAISEAADLAYPSTPSVGNEMLNRSGTSSQGAKARRLLLEGMVERGEECDLGLTGYGPEMAVYQSFLLSSGLHHLDSRHNQMTFAEPRDESLKGAWAIVETEFARARNERVNLDDVYAALMSPPVGMKEAIIPVFITAALLKFNDEVAMYEHGTFKPVFSADLSERMVRNPGHFDIKHFASATGARRQVIDALVVSLGVQPRFRKHRVANVLAVVGQLVGRIGRLNNYTARTIDLSEPTRAARDALHAAVEPDAILFEGLPAALGFGPVLAEATDYDEAEALAEAVGDAIEDLETTYGRMLDELREELLEATMERSRLAVVGQAAALQDEVLDQQIRAFVLTLGNESVDSDRDWIQAIATVVVGKAAAEWSDTDRAGFSLRMRSLVSAFRRLVALHADRRVIDGEEFDAVRVTFTRSDGAEEHCLVDLRGDERVAAAVVLDVAIDQLSAALGSAGRAEVALLGLMSERLLPTPNVEHDDEVVNLSNGEATSG